MLNMSGEVSVFISRLRVIFSRFGASVICLIMVFFFIAFFGGGGYSYADGGSADIDVSVPATTIIDADENCVMTLSPTSPFGYCNLAVRVLSNNSAGYSLYVSMAEEPSTTNDNTCLRHTGVLPPVVANPTACTGVPVTQKFSPVTIPAMGVGEFVDISSDLNNFTKGAWGVAYDTATSFVQYTGVPNYSVEPLLVKETAGPTTGEDVAMRFAGHYNLADNPSVNQVLGDYTGVVLFTVMNNVPPPMPNTMDWGFMQDFTLAECGDMVDYGGTENMYVGEAGGSLVGVNTVKLTDKRNQQTYRVRKMQDGKCWMIDNLKIYNATLTPEDSDIASGSFVLPDMLNTVGSMVNDAARVDDPASSVASNGGVYCNTTVFDDYSDTTTGCGYLYNWYTATAGKGTAGLVNATVADSICPKNWNLPTGGASGQFQSLHNAVSLAAGGGQSWQAPYAAHLYSGGFSTNTSSYFWSSMAHASGASSAYSLYFSASTANPASTYAKYNGFSVRCVL